jgi:hypothetical protein
MHADSRVDDYIGQLPSWQQTICQQVQPSRRLAAHQGIIAPGSAARTGRPDRSQLNTGTAAARNSQQGTAPARPYRRFPERAAGRPPDARPAAG